MKPLLEIGGITVSYGVAKALQGVSLTVNKGEWVALLGANGSGKSTLLKCISHQLSLQTGRIIVHGIDVASDPTSARRHMGVAVPPEILPVALTLAQCLDVHAVACGLPAPSGLALEVLDALQLTPHLNKPIGWLTLGLRQRASVTLAMVQNPSLLLLDESFNGLDAGSAARLESILVREVMAENLAVVMATHALPLVARCCTTAVLLHEGRCIQHWNLKADGGILDLETAITNALG
jgi:ABC-type multidrug transport system ATPase subunit